MEEFEKDVFQICRIYDGDETGVCVTEFQNLKVTLFAVLPRNQNF